MHIMNFMYLTARKSVKHCEVTKPSAAWIGRELWTEG
jgi:hypothetical protein